MRRVWPWFALTAVLAAAVLQLRNQGRLWWCACGSVLLWSGDAWSSDNSQHLFDPYGFTHILHGFAFCVLLVWLLPRLSWKWRLALAVAIEAVWEVFENSAFIINRYRENTLALGYTGDTIVNSFGDIVACGVGFLLARRLGFRRTLLIFLLTEIALLIWIRDSLILEILMLIYPIDAIKAWQMSH